MHSAPTYFSPPVVPVECLEVPLHPLLLHDAEVATDGPAEFGGRQILLFSCKFVMIQQNKYLARSIPEISEP